MDIEDKLLRLIKSSSRKGILQNKLWKKARIDSSKCSRILAKLEKERKISRETSLEDGVKTYLIKTYRNVKEKPVKVFKKKEEKPVKVSKKKEEKPVESFRLLLIGERFSPCAGCVLECVSEQCIPLSEWLYGLEEES